MTGLAHSGASASIPICATDDSAGQRLKVLDLFSGIGGFSLGLHRAGMQTVAFCEINPFARAVLAKHWPETPCYDDVRTLSAERLAADGISVDVICGGFPCQDLSIAGLGAGMAGERSGLWSEITRLVGELQPRYLLVENVANLLAGERGAWFGRVLGDLAALGYDAIWHRISAASLGAPHRRERVWIVAYPNGHVDPDFGAAIASGAFSEALEQWRRGVDELGPSDGLQRADTYADVRRVVHGIPDWAHRVARLGNAVVPQIPELIGRAILAAHSDGAKP
jgi:DNA (cytosine-5)-methyltransferase 1